MNSLPSRLKAVAVTALAFAVGAFCLLGIVWGLGNLLPDAFGGRVFSSYGPHSSIAALTDLRAISALTAVFLVLTGLVLLINSAYCDRMIGVLADVLLMAIAAIAGLVGGYWVLMRLAGYANFIELGFLTNAVVCPLIVLLVSLIPLAGTRAVLIMRMIMIVLLLIGGPALLVLLP